MAVVASTALALVLIYKQETSALQDPLFSNFHDKANLWISSGHPRYGREMDSVFFNEDRFEIMVDARGYVPENLKCIVGPDNIEIIAENQEMSGPAQHFMATSRSYQLPRTVMPQQALCCLSSEGILLITVPWLK